MNAVVGVLTFVVVVLAIMVVGLLRSHAEILRRLHRLDGGDEQPAGFAPTTRADDDPTRRPAVDIAGAGLVDDVVMVAVAGVQHRTLLAFLSTTCGTCAAFWNAFAVGEHETLPPDVRLVVVTRTEPTEDRSAIEPLAAPDLTLVMSDDAWDDYAAGGSPYFVLVDPREGVIGEGTGLNFAQLRRLLAQSSGDARFLGGEERVDAQLSRSRDRRASNRVSGGRNDSRRIDAELLAAGIRPGDPELFGDDDLEPRP